MKRHKLMTRLLVPLMIVLLLFPPLSCLIFSRTARQYAVSSALQDLDTLQKRLYPLLADGLSDDPDGRGQSADFLSRIGPLMANTNGNARLLILGPRLQVIYPRDEQVREAVLPLAGELARLIRGGADTSSFDFGGETYLAQVYEAPAEMAQLGYIVAYCPMSRIGEWVKSASVQVMVISAALAALAFLALWAATLGIVRATKRLCREAERIGGGAFGNIEPPFALAELEELRLSMNRMSDRLRQADEAQKTFFQNVSHELRNPLMSISGYAQGIERGVFAAPQEAAGTILEESTRLTALVNDLLRLSRLENGGDKAVLTPVPLLDALEDSMDRFRGLALQKGVSLRLTPFDAALCALGDEELLGQVLDNLLSNAIRYAQKTVTATVTCRQETVSVTVLDDGGGIAPEDLPHIFERCYKGKGGNFGIGLTIARSAALKMEGRLTAENPAEGGAAFTLVLKRA